MHPYQIVRYLWLGAGVVWLVGAFFAKRAARKQSPRSRDLQRLIGLAAILIGFSPYFQFRVLDGRFVPDLPEVTDEGIALTFLGVVLAVGARFFLGGNWSATVTVKADHTLVRCGPYAIVRHPIYTGLLLALLVISMNMVGDGLRDVVEPEG